MLTQFINKLKLRFRERAAKSVFKSILDGERPPSVPEDWVRSPTTTSPGWRWDDPDNAKNSVRFFRGDSRDSNLSHQQPFVIVVRDGHVLDEHGNIIDDEAVLSEA